MEVSLMYKRILATLDGSKLAEAVLPYAKELAGRLDLDIVFLHVCSPEAQPFATMHQAYVEHVAELVKQQAEAIQKKTGAPPRGRTIEVSGEVIQGYAADDILRYADEKGVDFILMASHGHSGIRRWAMGSVADKVLRASKVPVFLVRAGQPDQPTYDQWPRRTLVVPLDGSKLSEAVLPHVETLARQRGTEPTEVVLVRVCEPPVLLADYPAMMPISWDEHVAQEMARSKQTCDLYLADVEQRLKDTGLDVRSEGMVGNATDEIIGYADKHPFSIVVMATHGYSGITEWAYGNVASRVIHGASRPVFVVRPH
jgi:nucleotide-binding universal stress UspA family protein